MKGILRSLAVVTLCLAVAQALKCNTCAGLTDFCPSLVSVTCNGTDQCYTAIGTLVNTINVKAKGCLAQSNCNTTTSLNIFGNATLYSVNTTCCGTDLCNAAPGLAQMTPMSLTLVTLVGGFIAKAML